jgi:hypothetical protein
MIQPEKDMHVRPMIEVFRTNVRSRKYAHVILKSLLNHFPHCEANFDLEDCDRILRVEGGGFHSDKVIDLVRMSGHTCEVLD